LQSADKSLQFAGDVARARCGCDPKKDLTSLIERMGDPLHGTPSRPLNLKENGVVSAGNDAISPREAMTKSQCGFAKTLIHGIRQQRD
jgi:hypothetical protein